MDQISASVSAQGDAGHDTINVLESSIEETAQQESDDLLEHDCLLADARLLKRRNTADTQLAHYRSGAYAHTSGSVVQERRLTDRSKVTKRAEMDAFVHGER